MSSVVLSWSIFLALVGAVYWVYFSPKSTAVRSSSKAVAEDKGAGSIFLGTSGTESAVAGEKKKKKKKVALSNTAAKEPVSTGSTAKAVESTDDDDDVAQEVDQAELLRRLQSLKESGNVGGKKSSSTSSSTRLAPKKALAAPASPFATASQTSSAGADADIDEEEATRLPESEYSSVSKQTHSSDPSDMLEPSTGGSGVLKITSSTQLPRSQKQKTTSAADQAGVHASKNAKKKEKQKAAKEAEKAEQKARFELHRATMRAAESAKQKNKPQAATPPPPSAWTSVNSQTAHVTPPPPKTDGLLDTFSAPSTLNKPDTTDDSPIDSEDEKKQMRSTHLGNSYWEEIPEHLIGGWNEVQKKSRKQKKAVTDAQTGDESTDAKSGRENFQSKSSVKAPVKAPAKAVRQTVQKRDTSTSGNGFQLLDSGSTTSDTKNSSSDWAEIDDSDNWAVHPEE